MLFSIIQLTLYAAINWYDVSITSFNRYGHYLIRKWQSFNRISYIEKNPLDFMQNYCYRIDDYLTFVVYLGWYNDLFEFSFLYARSHNYLFFLLFLLMFFNSVIYCRRCQKKKKTKWRLLFNKVTTTETSRKRQHTIHKWR